MKPPFSYLDGKISFGQGALRAAAASAVVASIAIIVGGGVVRVSGSGLGCPDWPTCANGALSPTPEMGLHAIIEFVNRLLTSVICVVVGAVIVVARFQREPRPQVTRWAWAQFWVIVLNAVIGGLTVWARLNPFVVAGHFLAATLLLAAAAVTWDIVSRPDHDTVRPIDTSATMQRQLAWVLLATTTALMIVGTAVTGAGPHAGDSSDVQRMPFDWATATWIHAVLAGTVTITAASIWRSSAPGTDLRRRTTWVLLALTAQVGVGITQSATGLPNTLVVVHMLVAALVFIGAIRVFLETAPHVRATCST
ncbi:cytochrome oxidase assembly protein [Nocardia colli]|uniref:Cytochrome oxidase assembly protein n=1 Tax=Nocardia colli TaxID=2545717 RepID=A0A5N0EC32_9NOCA|nr:cytochrome oxidase assembly protein [Nocardia colli]